MSAGCRVYFYLPFLTERILLWYSGFNKQIIKLWLKHSDHSFLVYEYCIIARLFRSVHFSCITMASYLHFPIRWLKSLWLFWYFLGRLILKQMLEKHFLFNCIKTFNNSLQSLNFHFFMKFVILDGNWCTNEWSTSNTKTIDLIKIMSWIFNYM